MLRKLSQSAGLILATLVAGAVPAAAQAKDPQVTLRFGHWSPPQHPMSLYSVPDWVNDIEKESGGSIKIQVFPSAQLGQPADYYDIGRDGVADISWANVGLQPGRFPVVQAIEMPLLYADPQAATLAFHEWYMQYAEKEMKDVKLCQMHVLFPSELHSKKEFKSLEDFKGAKVRVPNSTQSRYMSLLGSVLVPVPATQARDAVEKGVADVVSFPWQSLIIFGIDTLLSYHMDVPIGGNGFELLFNKNSYNKLSPAQKKVIDDHCTPEWSARFMAPWKAGTWRPRDTRGQGRTYGLSDNRQIPRRPGGCGGAGQKGMGRQRPQGGLRSGPGLEEPDRRDGEAQGELIASI